VFAALEWLPQIRSGSLFPGSKGKGHSGEQPNPIVTFRSSAWRGTVLQKKYQQW